MCAVANVLRMQETQHLAELRERSAYPMYRALVRLLASLGVLLALVVFVAGWWAASSLGYSGAFVGGAVAALLLVVATFVVREVLLMVADRTDATLQLAARMQSKARPQR